MVSVYWKYPVINGFYRWHHDCAHIAFLGNTFWYATAYLKCQQTIKSQISTQTIKFRSGRNKFSKETMWNLQTRILFRKSHMSQLNHWSTLYIKMCPQYWFQLYIMSGICKWYTVTGDINFRMRRCFKDISKMQTQFLRSGIFHWSGMYER